ncbi:hypothetical protein Taro_032192 [Colocasia esculenta]|uniref:VQ domain-containing protein n=1 Tax=Colocasia esculenta TaxID=4460 RepID=A0A843VKQ5_COLES|nr:hypothetical protein [Colocasia esculenta]
MDSLKNVHQRSSKDMAKPRNKKKSKQVKVVYISNPMHFKASASEFKGLVQQVTGQDSDVAELSKFAGADSPVASADDDSAALSRPAGAGAALQQHQQEPYKWAGVPQFDAFDEAFMTPQALENFAAFMPTSLYYEPPPPVV